MRVEDGFDVVVVGAGLAGSMAAVSAAEQGARVAMVHEGPLFSGSSFFPGTWGLGLIGSESESDAAELSRTIQEVGCGMADPRLVDSFAFGIDEAIERVERMGVVLMKAQNAGEREFVPCFDHKHRHWRGIVRENFTEAIGAAIERAGVTSMPRCSLMRIEKDGDRACGVIVFDAVSEEFAFLPAGAVVIATGGVGGLFDRKLVAADANGAATFSALQAGCSVVNIEFLQMMPGIVHPCTGAVFNEKMFRHMRLSRVDGAPAFPGKDEDEIAQILECRSGHGPFTSRLSSRAVDLAIDAAGEQGLVARYAGGADMPEFARTYYEWLEKEKGVGVDDELRLSLFAHASNGGIAIDETAWSGVPGLFACGEATGGMHGADRIGGLSSANALVFGIRAGRSAAAWAARRTGGFPRAIGAAFEEETVASECVFDVAARMRRVMSEHCMVRRCAEGLSLARRELDELSRLLSQECSSCDDPSRAASTARVRRQLGCARAFVAAASFRRESRGSHYRVDAPKQDASQAMPAVVRLDAEGRLAVEFRASGADGASA